MKTQSKKLLFITSLVAALSFSPIAPGLIACCVGDYYLCESWRPDVIADVEENCDGCISGEVTWIDC